MTMPAWVAAGIAGVLAAALVACGPASPPSGADTGSGPPATGGGATAPAAAPWFEEVAQASGLVFAHRSGHAGTTFRLPETMGGGAALFDMDGDGDLDALLVQSGTPVGADTGTRHRLFRNDGRGRFSDATAGSGVDVPGYGMGVATGDYDNDGDLDLYLTNLGANVLLRNDGAGRFTDVTAAARVAGSGWSTSAAFFDADGDGDLDLFVTRYLDWAPARERQCFSLTGIVDFCSPSNYDAPTSDLFFRNNGNGTFTDASAAAGLATARGNGLGVLADDVNGDGRLDIFVANDGTPNHLWINAGDGRFIESALRLGVAIDQDGAPKAGMGVHAADVDDDGDNDLLVMNLDTESDSFFRNDGAFFVDATNMVGLRVVSRRFTRFGMALVDFDNDGRLDLYEANGRVGLQGETFAADPYAEPNLLFRGVAGPAFAEVLPRGGTATPLIATSRAAAFGDIDNDGGIDVLVVNRDGAPYLLRNVVAARGHWALAAVKTRTGRDALGAVLTIAAGGRTWRRDVRTAYSYLAANDARVHVGLGAAAAIDTLDVRWPGGATERFGPLPADQVLTVVEGAGRPLAAAAPTAPR
ncbi:MAG TPA: CRTAC1 family protein [Vicinamibacterales bacterium]|nr:CRTAC1 family protein [Vicinamibacterales bacterium]